MPEKVGAIERNSRIVLFEILPNIGNLNLEQVFATSKFLVRRVVSTY